MWIHSTCDCYTPNNAKFCSTYRIKFHEESSTFRTSDGALPSPPFDLAVARAEQRPFRDLRGNLITPK